MGFRLPKSPVVRGDSPFLANLVRFPLAADIDLFSVLECFPVARSIADSENEPAAACLVKICNHLVSLSV